MDKAWKREERIVAKAFNTKRALMTVTNEKSDIQHDLFCVDVKLRQRWQVDKWYDELRRYAMNGPGLTDAVMKHDKIPILTLRKPHAKRRLAVIDFSAGVAVSNFPDFLAEGLAKAKAPRATLKGAGLVQ